MKLLNPKLFWSSTTSAISGLESYTLMVICNICRSKSIRRTVIYCVVIALAVVMSSCGNNAQIMTVPNPKYYADDQVLKIMASRRAQIREMSKGISGEGIQEALGVRQESSQQVNVSAFPISASPAKSPATLPAEPNILTATPNRNLQQDFSTALRKRILTDQEITSYELLYLGDTQLLSNDKKVALLGFSISLNKTVTLENSDSFAVVHFKVVDITDDKWNPNNISVYAILPEMSSILVSESLDSATLTELAAQIGGGIRGFDVQAAARWQRMLEESMSTLLDVPIQFGIYDSQRNAFSVAFGPRRRLKKIHWFLQLIGAAPYETEYYIPAGTKTCYALILMDKSTEELGVYAYSSGDILKSPKRFPTVLSEKKMEDILSKAGIFDSGKDPFKFSRVREPNKTSPKPDFKITVKHPSDEETVSPDYLYPELTNTLLIISKEPVSAETEVFIGPVAVPKNQIEVLGRKRLRVTILPDERLKNLKEPNVAVRLIQPDVNIIDIKNRISLRKVETVKKEPLVVAQPREVEAGQDIKLIRKNKLLNLAKVTAIRISSMPEITRSQFHASQSEDEITFSVPVGNTPRAGVPLTIDLIFEPSYEPNEISIPEAIVYK